MSDVMKRWIELRRRERHADGTLTHLFTSMGSRRGGERSVVHRYHEKLHSLFDAHPMSIQFVIPPLDGSDPLSGFRAIDRGPAA